MSSLMVLFWWIVFIGIILATAYSVWFLKQVWNEIKEGKNG